VCITFLCVVYKMDFRLTVILTLVGLFAAGTVPFIVLLVVERKARRANYPWRYLRG
jgi:hypothetical protein